MATLSSLAVSDEEYEKLFEVTATQTARLLDSESHERTLCVALESLYQWTLRRQAPLSDRVLDIYKVCYISIVEVR